MSSGCGLLGDCLVLTDQLFVCIFVLVCVGSGNNDDDDFDQTNMHYILMDNMNTSHACMVWVN